MTDLRQHPAEHFGLIIACKVPYISIPFNQSKMVGGSCGTSSLEPAATSAEYFRGHIYWHDEVARELVTAYFEGEVLEAVCRQRRRELLCICRFYASVSAAEFLF